MLIIDNKCDLDFNDEGITSLQTEYGRRIASIKVSDTSKDNLEEIKRQLFIHLDVIRVHTKSCGTRVDLTNPIILKKRPQLGMLLN